jgi:hypothetical protein
MSAPPPPPDQPTEPLPPGGWGPPPGSPPPPTPKTPRTFTGRQVLAVAVVVGVIAFGIGAAVGNGGGTSSGTPKATGSASQSATTTTEVEVASTAASTYDTPEAGDFELTVKTLSKQCFGSAGCTVTYRIQAGWDGSYDPDKTYEVVYEVRGDESGPQTNNFTITSDEYQISQEEIASTRSSGVKLTARVVSVEEQ